MTVTRAGNILETPPRRFIYEGWVGLLFVVVHPHAAGG